MNEIRRERLPKAWDESPKGCWSCHPGTRETCQLPNDGHEVHKRKHPNGKELECWRDPKDAAFSKEEPKKGGEFPPEQQEAWASGYFWGQRSIVNTLVYDAREALRELVEMGDPHENPDCPQDDTCDCKLAAKINDVLFHHRKTTYRGQVKAP